MHALRLTTILTLLVTSACGSSDSGTDAESTTTPGTGSTADTPSGTTTAAATTTDGSTGHSHETHETHATSETGDTGSETAAVTTTETTHATHDTHESVGTSDPDTTAGTTGGTVPIGEYCECMLENCHDLYHATWGEDHRASEEMCAAYAASVPSVGVPAMSGDSLECRLHFCEIGHDDPSACDSAMGAAPCE